MSGFVVVDASLALKWLVPEPYSIEARAAISEWERAGIQPIAPTMMFSEAANALYRRVVRHGVPIDETLTLLAVLLAMGIEPRHDPTMHARALELAHILRQPASYDAQYLALAEREGCECWTADERLWNSVKGTLPWARWIGEYRPHPPKPQTPSA